MSARIRSSSSLSAVFRHAARKPSIRCPRARFNSTYEYPEEEIARREATRKATRNAAIALALIGAAGGLYYYESTGGTIPNPVPDSTFTVSHTYRNGKKRDFIFKWLPDSVLDGMMHEHEDSQVIDRPGNPVTRWDRNWIGSNEPCEDRSAIDLLPRNRGITPLRGVIGEKDLMLFSVIDGHGGWATSDLLEKTMHPTLALGLAGLQAGIIPGEGTWQRLAKSINPMAWGGSAWTPENIMHSLQASCVTSTKSQEGEEADEEQCFAAGRQYCLLAVQISRRSPQRLLRRRSSRRQCPQPSSGQALPCHGQAR